MNENCVICEGSGKYRFAVAETESELVMESENCPCCTGGTAKEIESACLRLGITVKDLT